MKGQEGKDRIKENEDEIKLMFWAYNRVGMTNDKLASWLCNNGGGDKAETGTEHGEVKMCKSIKKKLK